MSATVDRSAAGTRKRLLLAARSAFAERGFHGASVRLIARRAGLAPGLINYHFDGKDGLYRAVLGAANEELAGILGRRLILPSSPMDRLVGMASDFFDFVTERRDLVRILMREVLDDAALVKASAEAMRPAFGLVENFIRSGQESGDFAPGDPLASIHHVMGMIVHQVCIAPVLTPDWRDIGPEAERTSREEIQAAVRALLAQEGAQVAPGAH